MAVSLVSTGVTFPDSSTQITAATGFGFKNRLINGSMVIDQRNAGASQSITVAGGNTYTVDRWFAIASGATITGQRVAGSGNNQNNYRFTGAASVTGIQFVQRIESNNCYDLAGQTVTLSANFANSLLTTVNWSVFYAGTTDVWSGSNTTIASGSFTVSSTLTNFSTQISIPSAATTGLQIVFSVGAQTSGTWTIGQVQLEKGSTATSFDYRPYGTELALCQRYFEKSFAIDTAPANGASGTALLTEVNSSRVYSSGSTGNDGSSIVFKVQKRATPSITAYGNSSGQWLLTGNTNAGFTLVGNGDWGFSAYQTMSGAVVGMRGHWTASIEL